MIHLRPLGLALALAASPALAWPRQEPKVGSAWYEDKTDLGFKVHAPKDWEFVPGSPLEANVIGKYADPGEGKYVPLGNDAEIIAEFFLVKFDRRETGEKKEPGQDEEEARGVTDVGLWVERVLDEGEGWHRVAGPTPLKCGVAEASFSIYEGTSNRDGSDEDGKAVPQPVSAYVAKFPLAPKVDVALIGLGPAGKKWRPYENAYASLAKTLQPLAVSGPASAPAATSKDPRAAKRAKLQADIAKTPGWSLYETPNYFIVSCYDDKPFIEELKVRLEAVRTIYEKDYPPSLARKIRSQADAPEEEGGASKAPEPAPQERTVAAPPKVDALEQGKNSVVRLCKDSGQYLQYGGPGDSSGYFSSAEEELVIYDDKGDEGRAHTWSVLNHEGFHQYIHAYFGNLAPHSWYDEGTGDYYSGFEFNLKTKKFTAKKEIGRQDNLLLIRDNYVPLKDFVRWTQAQYYGENRGGIAGKKLEGWACYAQGWSLIWFLRTGAGKAKGWQDGWGSILDTYLGTLLETGDLDRAVDKAFQGVDWGALQESWRGYMM